LFPAAVLQLLQLLVVPCSALFCVLVLLSVTSAADVAALRSCSAIEHSETAFAISHSNIYHHRNKQSHHLWYLLPPQGSFMLSNASIAPSAAI